MIPLKTKTKQGIFQDKKRMYAALSFLLVMMVAAYFIAKNIQFSQPQPQQIQTGADKPRRLQNVEFTGKKPQLPTSLPLYTAHEYNGTPLGYAAALAEKLRLSSTNDPETWTDLQTGESLTYSQITKTLSYVSPASSGTKDSLTQQNQSINTTRALEKATAFIAQALSLKDFEPDKQNILYTNGEGERVDQKSATFIRIPFIYSLEGFTAVYDAAKQSSAYVILDKSLEIKRVDFQIFPPSPKKGEENAIISLDDALSRIKAGQGEILTALYQGKQITLENIDSIAFNSVQIEYRYAESAKEFYPYFLFTGIASANGEQMTEIGMLLPAVNIKN